MERLMLNSAQLPDFLLLAEIAQNVDYYWPSGLTFRQLLVYQMPVTLKLLNHLAEFETKPAPKWMFLAYPEVKKILKERDSNKVYQMVIQMDLATIMRFESYLNPTAVPYPIMIWLKQIAEAKLEFQNIVANSSKITYKFPGNYCNPTLTLKISPNFPFEPPAVEGKYLDTLRFKWAIDKTTVKLCCQRYTGHVNKYETIFEYISSLCLPGARVILVDDDGKPISEGRIKNLPLKQEKYLTLFCKFVPPSDEMDELYAEVVINIQKFDHFPEKIDILPKNPNIQTHEKLWVIEKALEQNLFDYMFGQDELMYE